MAGDWIKMRSNLTTHPKVVRISSALHADRFRVIGGLHAVWSLFDAHSDNGSLHGYTLDALDDLIGWPGFSAAMVRIEWLVESGETLTTPRFDDHNGQSAKRRAQDSDRKRKGRDAGDCPQDIRNVSACEADKKRTREEKRREENKEQDQNQKIRAPRFDAQAHLVGIGVDASIAADWIQSRKALKAAPTLTAIDGIAKESARAGISLADALAICCQRGWRGFKAEWVESPVQAKPAYQNQRDIERAKVSEILCGRPQQIATIERVISGEVVNAS